MTTRDRVRTELEHELYPAALRRAAVRPIAAERVDLMTEVIARRTDPDTARALADGLCLRVLLTGREFDRESARVMFAR